MEINDYDYKKMIKDFEMLVRFENNNKKLRKKWKEENKKYQTSIEHMKEFREQSYLQKNSELLNKLNKKESILLTSLENIRNDKLKEKKKMISQIMEKEKMAKENVEKFKEDQERLRLDFQRETNEKCKKYFYNIIYINNLQWKILKREMLI